MGKKLLLCVQRLADWYCRNTADDGSTPFMIYTEDRRIEPAYEWSTAFAFMGMISAYKVFGNSEYEQTAAKMLKYLKSLQIMDTASPHYGAFRERTPETNWCLNVILFLSHSSVIFFQVAPAFEAKKKCFHAVKCR